MFKHSATDLGFAELKRILSESTTVPIPGTKSIRFACVEQATTKSAKEKNINLYIFLIFDAGLFQEPAEFSNKI